MSSLRMLAVVLVLTSSVVARADYFEAAGDFTTAMNPNGVWTYGFLTPAGAGFIAYSDPTDADPAWHGLNLLAWSSHDPSSDSSAYSVLGINRSGVTQSITTIEIEDGELFAHPNVDGDMVSARFTAPDDGALNLTAFFRAADTIGGSRDVHIYIDGSEVFGAALDGAKPARVDAELNNIALNLGDTIDFAIGSNGDYSFDATVFNAFLDFTPVPEPSTFALLGLGLAGGAWSVWRKRSRRGGLLAATLAEVGMPQGPGV